MIRSLTIQDLSPVIQADRILDTLLHAYCYDKNAADSTQPCYISIATEDNMGMLTVTLTKSRGEMRRLLLMPSTNAAHTPKACALAAFQHSVQIHQHLALRRENPVAITRVPEAQRIPGYSGLLQYSEDEKTASIETALPLPTSLVHFKQALRNLKRFHRRKQLLEQLAQHPSPISIKSAHNNQPRRVLQPSKRQIAYAARRALQQRNS